MKEKQTYSILQPEKTEEQIREEELFTGGYVHFSQENSTHFKGHRHVKSYGVTTSIYDAQKNKTSKIQFEVEIDIRQFPDWGYFEYIINKKQVYINNQIPNKFVEELSARTATVLYPLQLQTTTNNELLRIINHEEIINRWKKLKERLHLEYEGEAINQYIKKFEKTLQQESALLGTLKHEVFYTLLFHNIYTKHNQSLEKKATINFPIIGFNKTLVFKGNQKVNKRKTYYNTAMITFDSELINQDIQANLHVEYDLDGYSFVLENVIANCDLKYKNTTIKTIKTNLYHLKEKPTNSYSFDAMKSDIRKREKAIQKEENKNLTLVQRFVKWLDT